MAARSSPRVQRAAAVVVIAVAACSRGSGGGDGGEVGLPGFDADPPAGLFPLAVASDGATLVTAAGAPFMLHAEAAWSLIAQPDAAGAMRYLSDRRGRGVDAILVNLIEHKFADHAPSNAAGDAPFTTAGDFSTPSEAYFAHADRVIDLAASQGIAVLLAPSYLGDKGGDEGWFEEMSNQPAAACRGYGDYVGKRYAGKQNIVWVWGGDFTPPSDSPGELCLRAIRDGIRAAEPSALATAHWAPESTSLDEPTFADSVDLVGVYTYGPDLPRCREARAAGAPRRPTYLLETIYEHERSAATSELRRQQWWGLLGCGAGEVVGNNPLWLFGSGWPDELDSPLSRNETRLTQIAQQVAWQALALDDALVAGDRGSDELEIAAARSADGAQALIYLPPDGPATVTVDLTRMRGPVTARWEDPTADRSLPAGDALTGVHAFATPGSNDAGDTDWVLMLTVP